MKKRIQPTILRIVLALILSPQLAIHAADYPLRDAVECQARNGLPNVLQKLRQDREVRIGYLGGSITAAPGWRVKSMKWFQEQYPKVKVSEINAAIGGTGSDLGVFRLQQDTLRHQPDLLFVEFAVNDGGAAPDRIIKAMEGIVRQTWRADPATDICFVYTISLPVLEDALAGRYQRSATAMEHVAGHYGIPTIHLGLEVARMVAGGRLVFKGEKPKDNPATTKPMVFSSDGVHPLVETGHQLYLDAIVRSMKVVGNVGKPGPHRIPKPLDADNWENAKLVPIRADMLSGKWTRMDPAKDPLAKRFSNRLPVLWHSDDPGATLSFRFKGTTASMYDLVGPDCGQVQVKVGEGKDKTVRRIDGYCTYHRLSKFTVTSSGTDETQGVRLTISAEAPDKAKILFERNRHDLLKNPKKYEGINWYVGSIMLIGDLVE